MTPWSWTGPLSGLSSVAWSTPAGVIVSITLGTVLGSTAQIGLVPPAAQTPNWNCCGVAAHVRADPGLNPSCPVRATVNVHPELTEPNADRGRTIVAVSLGWSTTNRAVPREVPPGLTHTGAAPNP